MAGRKTKLDTKLKNEICKLLAKGATDKAACDRVGIAESTFYDWMSRGESEPESEFSEFSEAVTQARAKAHISATVAFYTGLTVSRVKEKITKTYTETRLKKNGEPYDYSETTITEILRVMPPDWRAGEAWLKRRDAGNWSDKLLIEINPKQLETLAVLLRQRGLKASDVFDNMIEELANADSGGTSEA